MPTDPSKLLDLARKLAPSDEPTELRCAAGRAYYAAFHAAHRIVEGMATENDVGEGGKLSHSEVAKRLRTWQSAHPDSRMAMEFGVEALAIFSHFVKCRHVRGLADYQIENVGAVRASDVRDVIGKSGRILQFCAKVEASAARRARKG